MKAKVAELETKLEKRTNQRNKAILDANNAADSVMHGSRLMVDIVTEWAKFNSHLRAIGDPTIDKLLAGRDGIPVE